MSQESLSSSAQRFQDALQDLGFSLQVVELPDSTRTALEAAEAIGVQVGQIVKSLVFKTKRSGRPILVVASGAHRVNEKRIETRIDEPLGKASADFVRESTGFSIGGVPPVGHQVHLQTFVDQELLQYEEIWAAAGTPHAVFRLTPSQLIQMTQGEVISVQ